MRTALLTQLVAALVAAALAGSPAGANEPDRVPAGTLDASFGDGGRVRTDFASFGFDDAEATGIAAVRHGKVVVAGTVSAPAIDRHGVAIVRYDHDGNLDSTFGSGGIVFEAFPGENVSVSVVAQRNGKIVVGGRSFTTTGDQS